MENGLLREQRLFEGVPVGLEPPLAHIRAPLAEGLPVAVVLEHIESGNYIVQFRLPHPLRHRNKLRLAILPDVRHPIGRHGEVLLLVNLAKRHHRQLVGAAPFAFGILHAIEIYKLDWTVFVLGEERDGILVRIE